MLSWKQAEFEKCYSLKTTHTLLQFPRFCKNKQEALQIKWKQQKWLFYSGKLTNKTNMQDNHTSW